MHDIDLIPPEYRQQLGLMRELRRYGLWGGALLGASMLAALLLVLTNKSMAEEIRQLQSVQAITAQQRSQLENLRQMQSEQVNQHQLLEKLRSGTTAHQIFQVMDQALLPEEVWFEKWTFRRAMQSLDESQISLRREARDSGMFIVIPLGQSSTEYWEIRTHMTIEGKAQDHSALSRFVARLYEQPGIEDVKVIQTSLQRDAFESAVRFNLAIVVGDLGEKA